MVAYSFKARFEKSIRDGAKRHTLRNDRKRHARVGDRVQLYVGMRTKHCRRIGVATCLAVLRLRIDFDQRRVEYESGNAITTEEDTDAFAMADGFADWKDMESFWVREHPGRRQWSRVMIQWGHTLQPDPAA